MKDCKFLLPFVDELRALYPDYKIEWVRSDYDTEHEQITIDDKPYIFTDIGYSEETGDDGFPKQVFHASIVVEFNNISTVQNFGGIMVNDPYAGNIPPVRLQLFSDHKCLREIFKFILETDADLIRKQMAMCAVLIL
jgi:hypothetical protein